jgi:hypothetical protein
MFLIVIIFCDNLNFIKMFIIYKKNFFLFIYVIFKIFNKLKIFYFYFTFFDIIFNFTHFSRRKLRGNDGKRCRRRRRRRRIRRGGGRGSGGCSGTMLLAPIATAAVVVAVAGVVDGVRRMVVPFSHWLWRRLLAAVSNSIAKPVESALPPGVEQQRQIAVGQEGDRRPVHPEAEELYAAVVNCTKLIVD